jgi:hypothetical protein
MSCPVVSPRSGAWASLAGGLGAVLLPKCPLCFAAYGSALGALGLGTTAHQRIVEPLIALAVIVSFGLVLSLAIGRRDGVTPVVSASGALLVLVGRYVSGSPALTAIGVAAMVGAALRNAALCRVTRR